MVLKRPYDVQPIVNQLLKLWEVINAKIALNKEHDKRGRLKVGFKRSMMQTVKDQSVFTVYG